LEKENLIKKKNDKLKRTEDEYEVKLKELTVIYELEQKKKNDLESNLKAVKQDLEDIETHFPKEIQELKQRIVDSKKTTEEYEEKTKALAEELRALKA